MCLKTIALDNKVNHFQSCLIKGKEKQETEKKVQKRQTCVSQWRAVEKEKAKKRQIKHKDRDKEKTKMKESERKRKGRKGRNKQEKVPRCLLQQAFNKCLLTKFIRVLSSLTAF